MHRPILPHSSTSPESPVPISCFGCLRLSRVLILPSFRPSAPARPSAKWSPPPQSRSLRAIREVGACARAVTVGRNVRHCHHGATAAPANPISPSPTHPQSVSFPHPPSFLPTSQFPHQRGQAPFSPPSFPPTIRRCDTHCRC